MSGADDDNFDDLDDKASSMKSLWKTLPDEEPPMSGMAALMAAATAKAKEMAAPPEFPAGSGVMSQDTAKRAHAKAAAEAAKASDDAPVGFFGKLVDLFKRPPVLAMATVVVLVGGAVIVKRHQSDMTADMPAAAERSESAKASTPPLLEAPKRERAADEQAFAGSAAGSATTEAAANGAPITTDSTTAVDQTRPGTIDKNASIAPMHAGKSTAPDAVRKTGETKPVEGGTAGTPSTGKTTGTGGAKTQVETTTTKTNTTKTDPPPPPPPKEDPVDHVYETVDNTTAEKSPRGPTTKSPPVGVVGATPSAPDQLFAKCQQAAQRGDCVAARDLANKIAKESASTYRDRVLKDEKIVMCLKQTQGTSTLAE